MMEIFVVIGSTGEYAETVQWLVDAWPTEKEAKDRTVELRRLLHGFGYRTDRPWSAFEDVIRQMEEAPNGDSIQWCRGAIFLEYTVEPCELKGRVETSDAQI